MISSNVNGLRHANDDTKNTSSSQSGNSCVFTYFSTIAEAVGIPHFEQTFRIHKAQSTFCYLSSLAPNKHSCESLDL